MDSHRWLREWTTIWSEHSVYSVSLGNRKRTSYCFHYNRQSLSALNATYFLSTNTDRIALRVALTNLSLCKTCFIKSLAKSQRNIFHTFNALRFRRFTAAPQGLGSNSWGENFNVNNSAEVGENSWHGIKEAAPAKAALNPFPNRHGAF